MGGCARRAVSVASAAVARRSLLGSAGLAGSAVFNARGFAAAAADDGYLVLDEATQSVDDLIAKHTCILYFTASWCGPCKMIGPHFAKLAKEHGTAVTFVKIDVDDNGSTAYAAKIQAVPTFRAYKAGKLVQEFSGANAATLESAVKALAGK